MREKGFIELILLILITIAVGFSIWALLAKMPSSKTINLAKSIVKYPKADSWQIVSDRTFCFDPKNCLPPAKIIFESKDSWSNIYMWYRQFLSTKNWTTNSVIITSIPTSISFFNNSDTYLNCRAELTENVKGYVFTISCP